MSDSPTQILRDEHELILEVTAVLGRLVAASPGPITDRDTAADCVSFLKLYADACHHAKEEDILFPELERHGVPNEGGPIGMMLHEHRIGRGFVAGMGAALESNDDNAYKSNAADWIALITGHISKENFVLFGMADQIVTGANCTTVCADYELACSRRFGGKTRDELERLSSDLISRYPG